MLSNFKYILLTKLASIAFPTRWTNTSETVYQVNTGATILTWCWSTFIHIYNKRRNLWYFKEKVNIKKEIMAKENSDKQNTVGRSWCCITNLKKSI